MLLAVETIVVEEVEVSMEKVLVENLKEEVDKLEEYTSKEVVEGAAAHIKMELTSHI